MNEILTQFILGAVQGITEWLPISSSAFLVLIMTNLFGINSVEILLKQALFLHLGTFFAALLYFWKDVKKLILSFFKESNQETKKVFNFLLVSTLISGIIGFLFYLFLSSIENSLIVTGKTITFFIGVLLLFTGIMQIKIKTIGNRKEKNLKKSDGILLGFAQGLASFPGISRSGITVSSLLLTKFDDTTALKLSFLMSLPIVLLGNIFLNLNEFSLTSTNIYGLFFSFLFGIITIHLLMKLSKKINLGIFILIFAILMMLSVFI